MNRYQAVLFDWDDTLCHTDPHRYEHAWAVVRQLGYDYSLADVVRAFGRSNDNGSSPDLRLAIQRLPAELALEEDRHPAFFEAYLARDAYKQFRLYDDVIETLQALAGRNLRAGLISNNERVAQMVERLDVGHHFEVVVSPLTWGVGKPERRVFVETVRLMGLAPEAVVYVGDSWENDVLGARAAGMTPVLIDRFRLGLAEHAGAEHRVESLADLAAILETLLEQPAVTAVAAG